MPDYRERWLRKSIPLCEVCGKRPQFDPGSPGLGGALCMVCYCDL